MKYTVPQRTAVYYNKGNLLLSAAAGSGKTASLTRRIVRLVLDGEAKLSEMLVVTFTRAAAGEMRGRIRRALADAVEENRVVDPAVSKRAAEAIAELASASISTIHSFLYREMRQYFPVLGLPHDTRIADTGIAKTMKSDAMRDTVDDFFGKTGEEGARFAYLCDVIGRARDTSAIDRELLWLADRLSAYGADEGELCRFADLLDGYAGGEGDFFATPTGGVAKRITAEFAAHYARVFRDIEAELSMLPEVWEKYGDTASYIANWVRELDREMRSEDAIFSGVKARFANYAPPSLGSLSSKKVCPESEKFKFFRDKLKKDLVSLAEKFFGGNEDEIKTAAKITAEILRIAADVLSEYFAKLGEMKRSRSLVDYSDLETLSLGLFVSENGSVTEAAREVGGKYKYIFIDEYQDTNSVQDAIFRAVSEDSVRFMVGDIKQAIYGFRGADPRVFSGYRMRWDSLAEDELISDGAEITTSDAGTVHAADSGRSLFMSDNFRCDSAVIDFVNMISDYTLAHGGIPYTDADRLTCAKNGGETPHVPVEIVMIEKKRASRKKGEEKEAVEPKTVTGNAEAAYVASRIAGMIGKYSADGERVIAPSDIAVLMRSPGSAGADYEKELAVYGIPAVTKSARPITSYPSVMLIMCLLNFIDNPMRDIYTAGALRSAVFGFTLGDIIALREAAGELPLFTAVIGAQSPSAPLLEKCRRASEILGRYKTVSRGMTADRFLEFLIRDANLFAIPGIRASGEERDAIGRLCEMARAYESGGVFGGLSGFIDYVAEAAADDESVSPGAVAGGVQIMSIHASKGLEFPIVFLAECGKKRNASDESGTVLFDDLLGLGMMLPAGGGLARCDTVLRRAVAAKIQAESTAEEMRMLYVALTRAESTLVITGKTSDAESDAAAAAYLAEYSDGYDSARAPRYLDWILGAAASCGESDFYRISTVSAESVASGVACVVAEADAATADTIGEAELEERFAFEYPREYLAKIPSKLTVSRLYPEILDGDATADAAFDASDADAGDAAEQALPRPVFMTGERGSGAERGSATHVFMQFADFRRLLTCGARAELERLRGGGFISASSAELVDLRQIERFAGSSLMDKLTRSDTVKREFRFNVRMNAAEFTDDAELKEKLAAEDVRITVQGVVDCVFRDPDTGRLVLIDYKTDRVSAEQWRDPASADAAFRERHKNQLTYYRKICSRLFEEEIAHVFVYSTVLGRCIEM